MYTAIDIAKYLLQHDDTGKLSELKLVTRNGRSFYSGNACLNKYLHIAQNLHLAKTGEKLFSDDLYAYDNGGVVPKVQERYAMLINGSANEVALDAETADFLKRVMQLLRDATMDELIEISHEDEEWIDKHNHYAKRDQLMDSVSRAALYKEQYEDALFLMEGMVV